MKRRRASIIETPSGLFLATPRSEAALPGDLDGIARVLRRRRIDEVEWDGQIYTTEDWLSELHSAGVIPLESYPRPIPQKLWPKRIRTFLREIDVPRKDIIGIAAVGLDHYVFAFLNPHKRSLMSDLYVRLSVMETPPLDSEWPMDDVAQVLLPSIDWIERHPPLSQDQALSGIGEGAAFLWANVRPDVLVALGIPRFFDRLKNRVEALYTSRR